MLMRTDPFRDLDQPAEQVLGTPARPAAMDAWRDGDTFEVEFDLPSVDPESIDLDVERNVVTTRAERPAPDKDLEMLASERPRGVFGRQLVLGENFDTEHIEDGYYAGVLRLHIPVVEKAKPRKIEITSTNSDRQAVDA
ncbi:Hsp20/alpha crystallin family protein [Paeniglutamicibacter sp. NPDC012692]|uniref:Hsp20/alpha crystallin family protein n=1 Tax=Paeniglutamicibacter sp. NPDC012692 TaxID=3364388 RepID=UPI003697C647